VGGIAGKCENPPSADTSPGLEVTLISSETFVINSDTRVQGHISSDHSFLIQDILDSGVELHATCILDLDKSAAARKGGLWPCKIDIAIYAPFAMFQELKEWSEHNEVYLQDPKSCPKEAKYCNPQRLSLNFSAPVMVSQIASHIRKHRVHLRDIMEDDDLLDRYLGSKIELQETEQPSAVKTALQR